MRLEAGRCIFGSLKGGLSSSPKLSEARNPPGVAPRCAISTFLLPRLEKPRLRSDGRSATSSTITSTSTSTITSMSQGRRGVRRRPFDGPRAMARQVKPLPPFDPSRLKRLSGIKPNKGKLGREMWRGGEGLAAKEAQEGAKVKAGEARKTADAYVGCLKGRLFLVA